MEVAHAFRLQAAACERLESPLYAKLLATAADEIEAGAPLRALVVEWDGDPVRDALALRIMGGVHRAALRGDAPDISAHYPTTGGTPRWPACADAFLDVVNRRLPVVDEAVARPPQTNEIGRAGVLIGGLLEVARITGLPLRLRDIGASAGLNLLLDRFAYDLAIGGWGDPSSPVHLRTPWSGVPPSLGTPLSIIDRKGCDITPLDVKDPLDAERVKSYVWADQVERFKRTEAAIDLARQTAVTVAQAAAGPWLGNELSMLLPGATTVVMQSVVTQYLSDARPAERQADDPHRRSVGDARSTARMASLRAGPTPLVRAAACAVAARRRPHPCGCAPPRRLGPVVRRERAPLRQATSEREAQAAQSVSKCACVGDTSSQSSAPTAAPSIHGATISTMVGG